MLDVCEIHEDFG